MQWETWISSHPEVLHGAICCAGTRIPVSAVLDNLADGASPADILREFPTLKKEHLLAALAYAADLTRERVLPIPA